MHAPLQAADETFDVVVVGGSFAGLAFAGGAAARGLRVLVLERDAAIGRIVRTTGVLFSDVLGIVDVPAELLLNRVRRLRIIPPGDRPPIEVGTRAFRFYMADVPGMLGWLAREAEARGAEIRCGARFLDAKPASDRMLVEYYHGHEADAPPGASDAGAAPEPGSAAPGGVERVHARFVIGADGARSRVAEVFGLDRNTRLLAGAEWLLEGVRVEDDAFTLVLDAAMAPGYCAWLAPHGDLAVVGVAGHQRAFRATQSISAATEVFAGRVDLRTMRVAQRKAGVIPVGGRLRRVHRDDARGRALLIGDAAGLCGAATGGGIYPALLSGRLAAHAVANEVLNRQAGAVRTYLRTLPRAGQLGAYLRLEDWLRWALDRLTSNDDLATFLGLFATEEGGNLLRRVLLEMPFIGMDDGAFHLVRSLLRQHPKLYGSAVGAMVRRMAPKR